MNRFKTYVWMAAGFALVTAVVAGITAAPAVAQLVKAALVKNVDEPGRQPFEVALEYTTAQCLVNCVNFVSSGPTRLFDSDPAVPAGKRWVITGISGDVPSISASGLTVALQSTQVISRNDRLKFIYWGPYFSNAGFSWGFSSPVFTTVGPGERAHFNIGFNGDDVGLISTLVLNGYLIDNTN